MNQQNKPNKNNINKSYTMPKTKRLNKFERTVKEFLGVKRVTQKYIKSKGYNSRAELFKKEGDKMRTISNTIKKEKVNLQNRLLFKKYESQYKSYKGYKSVNRKTIIADREVYQKLMTPNIKRLLKRESKKTNIKVYSNFSFKRKGDKEIITLNIGHTADPIIKNVKDIDIYIREIFEEIERHLQEYNGFVFETFIGMDFGINKYNPISGSSYTPLPDFIKNKKCCINIKNTDNKCFLWSILASIHPALRDRERVSKYTQYESELRVGNINITDGMKVHDIVRFERLNKIGVNVFSLDECNKINILHHSVEKFGKDPINLFWYNDHYSLIKNFSRFSNKQNGYRRHTCTRCLQTFKFEEKLKEHKIYCDGVKPMQTILPLDDGEENIISFKNNERENKQPIAIYADFECITTKSNNMFGMSSKIQKHKSASYMFKIVGDVLPANFKTVYTFTGQDAHIHFVETLQNIEQKILRTVWKDLSMDDLTPAEKTRHCKAVKCEECGKNFKNQFDCDKVRDHDHCTGKYRKALCKNCNLQTGKKEKYKKFIPVIFHNLKGYDSHLIFKALMKIGFDNKDKLHCIPLNSEKFISFSYNKYRFIDSMAFLNSSLDTLVSNLDDADKYNLKEHYGDKFELVNKKGSFPYDWFNNLKKLDRKSLPPYEKWYSKLYDKNITKDEYKHAQKIWDTFNMKTFRDYHDVYLHIDVLGLADVFEKFRKISMRDYGLDPLHYYTLPGYSFDAMLKKTGVELELFTDPDKYLFVESGIRGGVSVQSHRYAEANEPSMATYDESKPNKFNMYLDANNLYGWAMMQSLPVSDFEWMTFTDLDVEKLNDCILEVDVDYPEELHDLHNDYPLLPEKASVNFDEISDYSKGILKQNNGRFDKDNLKLLGTLKDKKNYVIHIDTLKYALKLGLKLTKIHRGMSFKSSLFLKEYIDFNSTKRAGAANDFEKDFYKLMNNSVFGKTMENVRNRVNVKFVTNQRSYDLLVRKPQYKRNVLISQGNELTGVEMSKTKVILNKPIYLGFAILEYSKLLMQQFHYDYIKPKYGDKSKLLFTDTDSFLINIETKDVYKDMRDNKELFDFSNYPVDHPNYSTENKKVVGLFKDESAGECLEKFVGLKSKMYSLKYKEKDKNTCKGVQKCVAKNKITFEDYYDTLIGGNSMRHTIKRIMSRKHDISLISQNKVSLSAYDDKRWIHDDGITTYAYGHYKIKQL